MVSLNERKKISDTESSILHVFEKMVALQLQSVSTENWLQLVNGHSMLLTTLESPSEGQWEVGISFVPVSSVRTVLQ